ncbi:MAG: aminomethyltransferase family protein, partial [Acidobacteriota bacterium]
VGAEHRLVREGVALIDMSSFTKFEIHGPGAHQYLNWLAAANLDKPVGAAVYTQLCNARGGIEADLTIVRLADDRFYVVTGSGFGTRDGGWIQAHLPADGSVRFRDVTSGHAVLNLCGPLARRVLEKATADDVSNAGLPYMRAKRIRIGLAPVLAVRITYVGELGWELHIPTEYAAYVFDALLEAGREFSIGHAGYRAVDSLRMEKRYLYWSADITPDYNPFEAGLGFAVALNKGDFLGRDALRRIKSEGVRQKLCCFALERPLAVYGGETILLAGRVVGSTTSGNYGYTVRKSIVFGYVPVEHVQADAFEIEAFGEVSAAVPIEGSAYDSGRQRILL